jgi:hypothetical protein
MTDDELAHLLGEAPTATDPTFRFDVFARVAVENRRRAARGRALAIVAGSTALGLICAAAQRAGLSVETAQPLFYASVAAGLTFVLAGEARKSSRSLIARSLGRLRFRL